MKKKDKHNMLFVLMAIQIVLLIFLTFQVNNLGQQIAGDNDETVKKTEKTQPVTTGGSEHFVGPVDAETVVIEWSDFECPFCDAATGTKADLEARFNLIPTGKQQYQS